MTGELPSTSAFADYPENLRNAIAYAQDFYRLGTMSVHEGVETEQWAFSQHMERRGRTVAHTLDLLFARGEGQEGWEAVLKADLEAQFAQEMSPLAG
jgi:hypothetical protein